MEIVNDERKKFLKRIEKQKFKVSMKKGRKDHSEPNTPRSYDFSSFIALILSQWLLFLSKDIKG